MIGHSITCASFMGLVWAGLASGGAGATEGAPKAYAAAATPIMARFGGVNLERGARIVPLEGALPAGRTVVVEFPSLAAAQALEASPEYRAAAATRQKASTGRLFIVEGAAP